MGFAKRLINTMFNGTIHVEHLDARVRKLVDAAWIDNCEYPLFYATGHARRIFNETVSEYVRAYHARTGRLPEGDHDVLGTGRRMIYFAPVKESLGRQPLVATT